MDDPSVDGSGKSFDEQVISLMAREAVAQEEQPLQALYDVLDAGVWFRVSDQGIRRNFSHETGAITVLPWNEVLTQYNSSAGV
jgi:hypothetical protein